MNQATARQTTLRGFAKRGEATDDQPLDFSRAGKSGNNDENLPLENIPNRAGPSSGRVPRPAPRELSPPAREPSPDAREQSPAAADSSSFSDSLSLSPRSLNQTSAENSEHDAKNNRGSPFQSSPPMKTPLGINVSPSLAFSPPKVAMNVFNSTFAPYFPLGGLSHFNLGPLNTINPGGNAAIETGYMEFRSQQLLAQQRQQQMAFGTKRRRASANSTEPALSARGSEAATEPSDHSNDSTSITTSRQVNSTTASAKGGARKRGKAYPEEMKDDAYWERRRKNNEAAKRSRDARRAKEDETAIRAAFLEQEFIKLQVRNASLENELQKLRCMLCSASMKR